MKYCFRCGHIFSHKSNLNRHLSKKIPCVSKYLDVSGQEILDNFLYYCHKFEKLTGNNINNQQEDTNNQSEDIKIETTPTKMIKPDTNEQHDEYDEYDDLDYIDTIDGLYKCEGCYKIFNKKNNYYRHRKSYCPILKGEYREFKSFKKKLDNKYRKMKQEHIEKSEINNNGFMNETEELKNGKFNDIFNNENNTQTNQVQNNLENSLNNYNTKAHNFQLKQNTHDIFNKNEFNITINEYGKEDVSSVSQSEWKQIVKKLYCALPDLVKKVHFDIETNRNVYVPNIREKYAMVWKNDNWEMMDIRDVLDDLLVNNTDRIYEFLEENESFIGDSLHAKMNNVIEKIGNSKKLQRKYQDQIKMILINNRSVVRNTYEIESGKKLEIK